MATSGDLQVDPAHRGCRPGAYRALTPRKASTTPPDSDPTGPVGAAGTGAGWPVDWEPGSTAMASISRSRPAAAMPACMAVMFWVNSLIGPISWKA
ncbi:hypothetical protein GCM10029963_60010 [Micromonospora andamanensis]